MDPAAPIKHGIICQTFEEIFQEYFVCVQIRVETDRNFVKSITMIVETMTRCNGFEKRFALGGKYCGPSPPLSSILQALALLNWLFGYSSLVMRRFKALAGKV